MAEPQKTSREEWEEYIRRARKESAPTQGQLSLIPSIAPPPPEQPRLFE